MDQSVPPGRVRGICIPPCSKSYAQRALAASLLAATAAHASTNLVANGTFDNPDLATGTFEQVSTVGFGNLQWGYYSGGTGVTKLVDVAGE